jgi:hypothetical protein
MFNCDGVSVVATGQGALEVARGNHGPFDMTVSDESRPGPFKITALAAHSVTLSALKNEKREALGASRELPPDYGAL